MKSIRNHILGLVAIGLFIITSIPVDSFSQGRELKYLGQQKFQKMESYGISQSFTIAFQKKLSLDGAFVAALADASWEILGNQIQVQGIGGASLTNFIFETPGDYIIEIDYPVQTNHVPGVCGENPFPSTVEVSVLPYSFTIDFESIQWSTAMESGKNMDGATISVDVILESFNHTGVPFNWNLQVTGVGSNISGKPNDNLILVPGRNSIAFSLSGMIQQPNTYVSIDFIDPETGQTNTFYPSTPVN